MLKTTFYNVQNNIYYRINSVKAELRENDQNMKNI